MTRASNRLTSWHLPSVISMTVGIGPRKSSRVCSLRAPLRLRKWGPGKQAQAQVDGGGVEGIDRLLQLQTEFLVGIQASGFPNELLSQVGVDTPVPCFVGLGQGAAGHPASKPQTIQQLAAGTQTGLDVAQAFPVGQLGKAHGQKLLPAGETAHLAVPSVTLDTAPELLRVNSFHNLGKDGSSWVHPQRLPYTCDPRRKAPEDPYENSKRSHPYSTTTYWDHETYKLHIESKPDSSGPFYFLTKCRWACLGGCEKMG